ncbi:MAG: response regulator receiver protein [Deltaproteobacteria bacterium]|jgi:two-component system response regulator PilR (NtrC family)|nr:response regulator receiver protein [Deltaproteobacteria bacterium]
MKPNSEALQIMVVEDSKPLREMLVHVLKDDGNVVESARDGKEAMEKYYSGAYDLIITDLNMPEMTGIELIKRIREMDELVEFIIITAYASLETAIEAIKAGAYDYIIKPFKLEELKVAVRNVGDKISLKKKNKVLMEKLRGFYEEIDRYKYTKVTSYTEKIIKEIENLNRLKKEGLLKNEEFDDFKKRIFEKIL